MFRLCGFFFTGFLAILLGAQVSVKAQYKGSASISGRVTIAGKPGKGLTVTATLNNQPASQKPSVFTAVTNDEGIYHVTGLSAGNYKIAPYDPTNFLTGGQSPWEPPGKTVTLNTDEAADKIDFDIARGGVITGRITSSDGKPMIEMQVSLEAVDRKVVLQSTFSNPVYQTDDRGIYRIYGLPAGQYIVSVGEDRSGSSLSFGREKKGFYPRTFYPGSTEKSEAKPVDLDEGAEAKNIDIILSPREKTYSVSGLVVDEESGKPVPNVQVGYGTVSSDGRSFGASGFSSSMRSDAAGEFRIDGIKPGKYAIYAAPNFDDPSADRTSTPVNVEIADTDVQDVEIKTRPAISVDGVVLLESVPDPRLAARLSNLSIYGYSTSRDSASITPLNFRSAQVKPDHSFHLSGLSPGKFTISLSNSPAAKGFTLRRVELNGAAVPENSIELTAGSNIANVRMVLSYGTATIRGQVNFPADLPQGLTIWASATDNQHRELSSRSTQVDARGRFVIENLTAGEYIVSVLAFQQQRADATGVSYSGKQTVTVADGSDANVTITLAINTPNPGGDRP